MSCHNLGSFTDLGIFADEFLSFLRSRFWSFRSWSTWYIYIHLKTWLPILVEPHPQSSNQMGEFASCSKYGFCVSCSWSRFLMFILSSGINPNDAHALFLGYFLRHGENRKEMKRKDSGVPVKSGESKRWSEPMLMFWTFPWHWLGHACFAFPNTCVVLVSHSELRTFFLCMSHPYILGVQKQNVQKDPKPPNNHSLKIIFPQNNKTISEHETLCIYNVYIMYICFSYPHSKV